MRPLVTKKVWTEHEVLTVIQHAILEQQTGIVPFVRSKHEGPDPDPTLTMNHHLEDSLDKVEAWMVIEDDLNFQIKDEMVDTLNDETLVNIAKTIFAMRT